MPIYIGQYIPNCLTKPWYNPYSIMSILEYTRCSVCFVLYSTHIIYYSCTIHSINNADSWAHFKALTYTHIQTDLDEPRKLFPMLYNKLLKSIELIMYGWVYQWRVVWITSLNTSLFISNACRKCVTSLMKYKIKQFVLTMIKTILL